MYNRRGFFSKIGSVFERQGDTVFFGMQCVINIYGEDTLREKLHNVIESGSSIETPAEKRSYYKRIAALLREDLPFLEYGYWDYLTKKGEADAEFNEWVTNITAMMATEEEELGDDIDEMHRLSSDKVMLLSHSSSSLRIPMRSHHSSKRLMKLMRRITSARVASAIWLTQLPTLISSTAMPMLPLSCQEARKMASHGKTFVAKDGNT